MTWDRSPRKLFLRLGRRQFACGMAAACSARRARADESSELDEDLQEFAAPRPDRGRPPLRPRHAAYLAPGQNLPLAVLLHGLGETTNERLGAYAWVEKYGLGSAWQRLKRAPIERTSTRGEWTDARLAEVNAELAARPFRGMALACPFMPNPKSPADLDAYASWIEKSLVPRVRKETQVSTTRRADVPLRRVARRLRLARDARAAPASLRRVGRSADRDRPVRGAGLRREDRERMERCDGAHGPHPMLLLTSTQDHWKASSEALVCRVQGEGPRHHLPRDPRTARSAVAPRGRHDRGAPLARSHRLRRRSDKPVTRNE